jgi:hypothetical protein
MGDAESGLVRLSFDSQLRVELRGATVTSDAKTADEILASVARFCQRISNSGHKGALP